jgi:hypothetical protein
MANYCCLNPNCLAQFNRSSSLNRHYSRNPSCSPFRHNGFDSPVFGTARPHGTKLLVPHEASTSRSSNVDPGKANVKASNQASDEKSKSSSGSVNSDDYASLGKLEHTDMSFSFFYLKRTKTMKNINWLSQKVSLLIRQVQLPQNFMTVLLPPHQPLLHSMKPPSCYHPLLPLVPA